LRIPRFASTGGTGSGVLNLSLLAAGVGTSGGVGVGSGPSVGGQRPRNNNFTIEGVDNNNKGVTGPLVAVPNDAVAEFSLLQNQFSPEYGHSSGGQFNTVVKSGNQRLPRFGVRLQREPQLRCLRQLEWHWRTDLESAV